MTAWPPGDLERIGEAEELEIASRRPDASLRPYVTIWSVRHDDDLYVRSAHGRDNPWFRRAVAAGVGRIRAGGVEREVAFEEPGPEVAEPLHAAFHAKYDRSGPQLVGPVVSPKSAGATLRLVPR